MEVRAAAAKCLAAPVRFGLKRVLHRAGENLPGKLALYLDPQLIRHLSPSLTCGSICVVGTNGKTTTSNLIADSLEQAGFSVCCNRTGANLDSGVASALLETVTLSGASSNATSCGCPRFCPDCKPTTWCF